MSNITRRFRLFQFVLLTFVLPGCASAVDEQGTDPPAEEPTGSTADALKAVNGDAATSVDAGCDAAPAGAASDPYQEYESILETESLNVDTSGGLANTCTRVCACCKRGNRFCCSHCHFCSGPIGVSTGGVLAR